MCLSAPYLFLLGAFVMENQEVPIVVRPPVEKQPEILDIQAPGATADPPTEEQVRMASAAFARQQKETNAAGAIMAVWMAGIMAPDIIRDFTQPDEEDEEENRKRPPRLPTKS